MKTTSEIVRLASLIRLEKVEFEIRRKTDKLTKRVILAPTMEVTAECDGQRMTKKLVLYRQENLSGWRYSYDIRDMVSYLIFGTTNVRPDSRSSREHYDYATAKLRNDVSVRVRRFSKRKDVREAEKEADRKDERLSLIGELQDSLDKLVKRFPGLRKQDVLLAFDRAKNREVVRQVMET